MKRRALALLLFGLAVVMPGLAAAADAYLIGAASLRAGPAIDYPRIMVLPAGVPVSVYGCTTGFEWCDVQAGGDRGWVSGQFLQYDYQSQRVLLPEYGARVGIPIVAFVLGTYWDQHYRSRPWYHDRDRWSHRTIVHRPPPRPAVRPPPARPRPSATRPPAHAIPRPPNVRPQPHAAPQPPIHATVHPAKTKATPAPPAHRTLPAGRPVAGNAARPPRPAKATAQPAKPEKSAKPVPKKKDHESNDDGHR